MRRAATVAVLAALAAGVSAVGQPPPVPPPPATGPAPQPHPGPGYDPARVKALVEQLAAPDFRTREKAGRDLLAVGDRALPDLKKLLKGADDEEARRRLEVIVRRLETDRLARPRLVTLKMHRRTAKDALAELARQSGYPVQHQDAGDATDKAGYSFDLVDVPFWQALDAVCDAAGLTASEQDDDGTIGTSYQDTYSPFNSYSGPFKVQASNVSTSRSIQLSGLSRKQPIARPPEYLSVTFTIQSEPKAPMVGIGAAVVTKATDENGGNLLPPEANPNESTSLYPPQVGYKSYSQSFSVNLLRADRAALEVKELKGKLQVMLLAATPPELVVDDVLNGKKKKVAGRTAEVEVTNVDFQNNVLTVDLTVRQRNGDPDDYTWLNAVNQRLEVVDAAGERWTFGGVNNQNTGPGIATMQATFNQPASGRKVGPPARLQYVEWVTVNREVEFAFKDLPLP